MQRPCCAILETFISPSFGKSASPRKTLAVWVRENYFDVAMKYFKVVQLFQPFDEVNEYLPDEGLWKALG